MTITSTTTICWREAEDGRTKRVVIISTVAGGSWYNVQLSCGPTLMHVSREACNELIQKYKRYIRPFPPTSGILRRNAGMSVNDILINPRKDILYLKGSSGDLRPFLKGLFGGRLTMVTAELQDLAVECWQEAQLLLDGDNTILPRIGHVYVQGPGLIHSMKRVCCRIVGFPLF